MPSIYTIKGKQTIHSRHICASYTILECYITFLSTPKSNKTSQFTINLSKEICSIHTTRLVCQHLTSSNHKLEKFQIFTVAPGNPHMKWSITEKSGTNLRLTQQRKEPPKHLGERARIHKIECKNNEMNAEAQLFVSNKRTGKNKMLPTSHHKQESAKAAPQI